MAHIVTKSTITNLLNSDNPAKVEAVIGRALVVLLNNQTADEQRETQTKYNNGMGFAGADARSGTMTAKYWMKHKRLEDWMVEKWTRNPNRLSKYWRQLDASAQVKARG